MELVIDAVPVVGLPSVGAATGDTIVGGVRVGEGVTGIVGVDGAVEALLTPMWVEASVMV